MSRLLPSTVWRRIVLDAKLPCKTRLEALDQLKRPSVNLLRKLLASPLTPGRLRLAAAKKYDLEIARRELNARQEHPAKDFI